MKTEFFGFIKFIHGIMVMVCGRVCLPWYVHQGGSNKGGEDVSKRPTWLILNLPVGVSFTDFIL